MSLRSKVLEGAHDPSRLPQPQRAPQRIVSRRRAACERTHERTVPRPTIRLSARTPRGQETAAPGRSRRGTTDARTRRSDACPVAHVPIAAKRLMSRASIALTSTARDWAQRPRRRRTDPGRDEARGCRRRRRSRGEPRRGHLGESLREVQAKRRADQVVTTRSGERDHDPARVRHPRRRCILPATVPSARASTKIGNRLTPRPPQTPRTSGRPRRR